MDVARDAVPEPQPDDSRRKAAKRRQFDEIGIFRNEREIVVTRVLLDRNVSGVAKFAL
jgi:hypothetical protein